MPKRYSFHSLAYKLTLLLMGGLFVVVLVRHQIAEYYANQLVLDDASIDRVLNWNPHHPRGLRLKAAVAISDYQEPETYKEILSEGMMANPGDSKLLLLLTHYYARIGENTLAEASLQKAELLDPSSADILEISARYWGAKGDWKRVITLLGNALSYGSRQPSYVYELLASLDNEVEEASSFFRDQLDPAPDWWPGFFSWLSTNWSHFDQVESLYRLSKPADNDSLTRVRKSYLARLWRDKRWKEAYNEWFKQVETQASGSQLLYDGDFLHEPNQGVFGWILQNNKGVRSELSRYSSNENARRLRLRFNGKPIRYAHLLQNLRLHPGRYRLESMLQTRLEGEQMPRWSVFCIGGGGVVARSDNFPAKQTRQPYSFEFEVPEKKDCSVQRLRLEVLARKGADTLLEGEITLDSLAITER